MGMETTQVRAKSREIQFQIQARQQASVEGQEPEMIVEGKAVSFNSPTVLFEIDGVEYSEQIDDRAFEDAKMDDVIFNYNHGGKVMARTRNNTLELEIREDGFNIKSEPKRNRRGKKTL